MLNVFMLDEEKKEENIYRVRGEEERERERKGNRKFRIM